MSTEATTKRGPYARTTKRREEIAQAVLDLVTEQGHESVTVAQVAERTAISEATVLYHYPSRDHLLIAALELSDQLTASSAHAEESDIVFSLTQLRDLISQISFSDRLVRLTYSMRAQVVNPEHPAQAYFSARNARQVAIFTRLISQRQRDGFAHPALDPRTVAVQFIATWDGLTLLWLTDDSFDIAQLLLDAYRRLAGENVMAARALVAAPDFGI